MDALDISNNTTSFDVSKVKEWVSQGVGLAIIQLITGVRRAGNDCATQIMTCLDGGMCVDCYLFPSNDGLQLTTQQRLALVPEQARYRIRQLWVDVEPAYSLPSKVEIDTVHVVCDKWAPWQRAGNYSALWVASKMGWLPWPWPNRKQWLVNALYSGAPNLGGGFAGTNMHVATQYREDVVVAGVSGIDRSLLSLSEQDAVTRWLGGPMPIVVGQGMDGQMKANTDTPLCDHVEYEQMDDDGTVYKVEKCYGSKGLYISSNSSGQWVNAGPV